MKRLHMVSYNEATNPLHAWALPRQKTSGTMYVLGNCLLPGIPEGLVVFFYAGDREINYLFT